MNCPDCFQEFDDRGGWIGVCDSCHKVRVTANHKNDGLPVGKSSCSIREEMRPGCSGPRRLLQTGGGIRVIRKSEPLAG